MKRNKCYIRNLIKGQQQELYPSQLYLQRYKTDYAKTEKKAKTEKIFSKFSLKWRPIDGGSLSSQYLYVCRSANKPRQMRVTKMQSIDFGKQANNNFKITKYTHTQKYTYELTKRINGPTDTEAQQPSARQTHTHIARHAHNRLFNSIRKMSTCYAFISKKFKTFYHLENGCRQQKGRYALRLRIYILENICKSCFVLFSVYVSVRGDIAEPKVPALAGSLRRRAEQRLENHLLT